FSTRCSSVRGCGQGCNLGGGLGGGTRVADQAALPANLRRQRPSPRGGAVTTPARRARSWAAISFGVGIGLVVGSLIAALLVIAHDYGAIDLNVRTGTEVER